MDQKKEKIENIDQRLRAVVFRSNCNIYASIIDDKTGNTLVSASSLEIKEKKTPTKLAEDVGELAAKKASAKKIKKVYFDRNKYRYHGQVKALAEGLRKGGLEF